MVKLLIKEREVPEILPYETDIVEALDSMIKDQEDAMAEVNTNTVNENFFSMIYKTEIERLKYILKAYLRTRLFKIQKYYLYIIKEEKSDLLSQAEMKFAGKYFLYKRNHFKEWFLKNIPESLTDFVEATEETKDDPRVPVSQTLVTSPKETRPVFIRMLRDIPRVNDFKLQSTENLKTGQIMLIPYEHCKDLIDAEVAEVV